MAGLVVTKWHTKLNSNRYTVMAPFGGRPEARHQPGAEQPCDICGLVLGEVGVTVVAVPPAAGGVMGAIHPHCAGELARALTEAVEGEAAGEATLPGLRLVR